MNAEKVLKTASGLTVAPSSMVPDRFVIGLPGRKVLTCICARVLYWEDTGEEYRAECCGLERFERKAE